MTQSISADQVNTIILACEAGMGSSLMSVNSLKKKLKKANVGNVKVVHQAARAISPDTQLIVVHKGLEKVVRGKAPNAVVITFSHFLNDPAFDKLVDALASNQDIVDSGG